MKQPFFTSLLIFLIFILIYSIGSFDRIPFADCVGFVLTTEHGNYIKAATATSHFLYINTAILIKNILGIDAILANRILVVTSAALTVAIIYHICLLVSKKSWIAITSAFVFGLSFTFWRNAEIVEVYTFTSLWISLFFYFLLKNVLSPKTKHNCITFSSLFLGFAIWSHIQNIFLIPSFLIMLYLKRSAKQSVFTGVFILAFTFILMIGLNSLQNLPFKSFYSSEQGNWVEDSFQKSLNILFSDFLKALAYLFYNFNILTFVGIYGALKLYKNHKKVFCVILPAAILNFGFATFYAVSDNYVFFLPFNIIFATGIAYGIQFLRFQKILKVISPSVLLIPLLYYSTYKIAPEFEKGFYFDQGKSYKGGLKYYLLPWMNDNVGILEFTIDKKTAPEPINWMTYSAEEYIKLLKSKGKTEKEIRKL